MQLGMPPPGSDAAAMGPSMMWRGGAEQAPMQTAAPVPQAAFAVEEVDAAVDENDDVSASYDHSTWAPAESRYGVMGLMQLRQAMLPIEKPPAVAHLKFLIVPGYGVADDKDADNEPPEPRLRGGDRNKGKGKGGNKRSGGRFVEGMGKTEVLQGFSRGQWWRNIAQTDVIARESFSLMSVERWKVPAGHYVMQGGPVEVFVNGQAAGLQRMPVLPHGWVTVDATTVGGPKYLEPARCPRWKVVFRSNTPKGDIVVRESLSLESDEVAHLRCGTLIEQSGAQETLEDGIIRMPIYFDVPAEPSKGSSAPSRREGWVTCDATAMDGPKFFEPVEQEVEPPATPTQSMAPAEADRDSPGAARQGDRDSGPVGAPRGGYDRGAPPASNSWDKNRIWRISSLEPDEGRSLPIVSRAEPYAPGTGRVPSEDLLVRWLENGDMLEQVGHSKKMRGYMVMPVRMLHNDKVEGWVTRRLVDKTRDNADKAWMVEVRDNGEELEREHRKGSRRAARD
mmetsp:Transcript_79009/g.144043  ORF Transcript_79009/g.144043 Transcript_79009/m.144043 type:complete len:508 (-) Transcript_79009:106-1629(-)